MEIILTNAFYISIDIDKQILYIKYKKVFN